jgi:hypothetical protein
MSLTLQESCQMYDRYCRRHIDTPSFADFNAKHFTCLPNNPKVNAEYERVLVAARRAAGIPVTRRLPSLYKKLSGCAPRTPSQPKVQIDNQYNSFKSTVPVSSMKMNIRQPTPDQEQDISEQDISEQDISNQEQDISTEEEQVEEQHQTVAPKWSVEEYKQEIAQNKSILLKESSGHMVHLIPETKKGSFESLACKLTKSTWETLRGKSKADLKMRDGSTISIDTISLDEGDLAQFVNDRKSKKPGPHFIRFSRI